MPELSIRNSNSLHLYTVGKIIGCFGVRGYLKIQPSTHSMDRLKTLHQVFVGASADQTVPDFVEDVKLSRRSVLIKLEKVDDRTTAEKKIGQFLFIKEKELEEPKKGAYFIHDIVGCEVLSTDGQFIGVVENVYKFPAQDVWEIRAGKKLHLVPAVKEFIKKIDIRERKITISLMKGLIEE